MNSPETKTEGSIIAAIVEFEQWCENGTESDIEAFLAATSYSESVEQGIRDHVSRQRFIQRLTEQATSVSDRSGFRIGNYCLERSLGRGGQGEVFLAMQTEPVHREVALKLLHLHALSDSAIQRVGKEAQALALLSHPDIACIFDSGRTDDGTPYFVMDYAPGVPITAYCDQHELSVENRMRVLLRVCKAIEHAHRNKIIHRDIKPDNLLVWNDDEGIKVKVVDFGFAKLSADLTERFGFEASRTETIMGTPHYASPEQLGALAEHGIDTAGPNADVYSLGVVLYELLCGHTPHELRDKKRSTLEQYRNILTDELTPVAPSKRIASPAGHNGPRVPHELDWIALKAIEYNPDRRYASVRELTLDIGRFLNHEPIKARPPSALYHACKWVHRKQRVVLVAILVVMSLIVGATVTNWHASIPEAGSHSAVVFESNAGTSRTSVLAVYLNCLTDNSRGMLHFASVEAAEGALRTKGLLGHLNPESLEFVKDNPASVMGQLKIGAALCENSGDVPEYLPDYFANAKAVCSQHLEKFDDALDPLIALVGKYEKKPDKTRHEYEMLATFHFNLAESYRLTHQYGMAMTQMRNAMRIDNRILDLPANTTLQVSRLLCLAAMGNYDEAITVADRILADGGIDDLRYQHQVSTLTQVGVAFQAAGKLQEAESTLRIANALLENGASTRIARLALRHYSNLLLQNRQYDQARQVVESWQKAISNAPPEEPPTNAEIEMADASMVECHFGLGEYAKSYRLSAEIMAEQQNRRNQGLSPAVDHLEKYRIWVLFAAAQARANAYYDESRMNQGVLSTYRVTPAKKRWYVERIWELCREFYSVAGLQEAVERCDEKWGRLNWVRDTIPLRSEKKSFARIRRELSSTGPYTLGAAVHRRQASARGDSHRAYENGMIFSHMNDGAHAITGAAYSAWKESGGLDSPWGHPISSTTRTPDGSGAITRFEKAILFDHPTYGCRAVVGDFMVAIDGMSSEHPKFIGFPIEDEVEHSDRTEQEFEFGSVVIRRWKPKYTLSGQSRSEVIEDFEDLGEGAVSKSIFFTTCAFVLTSDGELFVSQCGDTSRKIGWMLVENGVKEISRSYEGIVTGARLKIKMQSGDSFIFDPSHARGKKAN